MTAWSASETDAGDLDVVALESPIGTFGLEATLDDTNAMYVQDDSPDEEDLYRGRVYLRPEGLTIGTGETLLLLSGKDTAGTSLFQLQVQQTAGVYQVKAFMLDGDNNIFAIGWMDLHKEWNAIEISWKAAGELTLWVNDTQAGQLTGQTATPLRLDKVRLGALSVETGTSGSLYLTAYASRRDSKIGLVANIPLGTVLNARYYYDGDGNQVKSVVNGVTTYYVGGHYEVQEEDTDTTIRKYYGIGLQKVAMRTQVNAGASTVNWLLGDHLGSTSLVANADGSEMATFKYSAFGKVRDSSGTSPTDYLYTGQRNEPELGLYYYVARWYDPEILHFAQADTIVPGAGSAQNYDRYAYVNNNPMRYIDPSGHYMEGECGFGGGGCGNNDPPTEPPTPPLPPVCYYCQEGGGNNPPNLPHLGNDNGDGRNKNTDLNNDGFPDIPDPFAESVKLGTRQDPDCMVGELVSCFYRRGRMPSGNWDVPKDAVDQLMLAVYYDISKKVWSPFDWYARIAYDTPFWDGKGLDIGDICVSGECYDRNEVNYFAQGMYSAKYEGKFIGLLIVNEWNVKEYSHPATAGEYYWFEQGYDYYVNQAWFNYGSSLNHRRE